MASKTLCVLLAFAAALALAPAAGARPFPETIALPNEWRPEGIATGKGSTFYVSSIPQGAVWRGDYRTGEGSVLVEPRTGRNHIGLKFDQPGATGCSSPAARRRGSTSTTPARVRTSGPTRSPKRASSMTSW